MRGRIETLPVDQRHFDLIAVTHIDTDHIGGMLKLMSDPPEGLVTDDFWFNGWPQLPGTRANDQLGPIDGEILGRLIEHAGWPWNDAFDNAAVAVPDDPGAPLPTWTAPGGLRLTVVGPTVGQLTALKKEWRKVLAEAGLDSANLDEGLKKAMQAKGVLPKDLLGGEVPNVEQDALTAFTPDRAVANSTSIALLAELGDRRILLTGDAWAPVLEVGLGRLLGERHLEALPIDLLKVAHHGSRNNTSMALLDLLACNRFLFSSSGAIFHHPDHQTVSRAIQATKRRGLKGSTLYFNYRSADNEVWDTPALVARHGYTPVYPDPAHDGFLKVEV